MKIETISNINLNKIFKQKRFVWVIVCISIILSLIDNFFKMDQYIGSWHIVLYILILIPLIYLIWKKELKNPYTKWFIPLLFIMIWDMFYYSNDFVQIFVPIIFYYLVLTLYLTSMQNIHSFYQTLLINFDMPNNASHYYSSTLNTIFIKKNNNHIYRRIGFALIITLPFLLLFTVLLISADMNFNNFLTDLLDLGIDFNIKYLGTVPLTFFIYLLLFIHTLSNYKNRTILNETKAMDMLIVGIFLGMINFLFLIFISIQIPFLSGENYLPIDTDIATFAREGFFQLLFIMAIVLLIFFFIIRRFKGEKLALILLSALLVQTVIMGLLSLKKMHLYQSIKGATVLRYYVEWFDYFLISILLLGLFFFIRKIPFSKLLNVIAVLGMLYFIVIISLNIEAMVASHNIEKFKNNPKDLDKSAISNLSIDALPAIQQSDIVIKTFNLRDCSNFSNYHFGYCSKLSKYGNSQFKKYRSSIE